MPQQVCYRDFPLWQFASTKQFVLNKLSASSKGVVIAHPKVKHGYSDEDLKKLSGYNLFEVLNHAGNASDKWDVALSAGKPVWIVGDDDTHDALDLNQTFKNWTMINCNKHNKDSLIQNLISGNAYAVNGKNAFNDNQLISVMANGMHISLHLKNKADSILLIGQNGIKRKVFFNTNKADYTFLNNDSYIREVIYNKATTMYLNPIVRFDGKANPQNILTTIVDSAATIFYRSFLLMCWLIVFIYFNQRTAAQILKLFKRGLLASRKNPRFG